MPEQRTDPQSETVQIFNLQITEPGVYRVTHEELAAAGLRLEDLAMEQLSLSERGDRRPLWLEEGLVANAKGNMPPATAEATARDGRFGPGDALLFIGQHLVGDDSFLSSHSRFNTYRLQITPDPTSSSAARDGVISQTVEGPTNDSGVSAARPVAELATRLHLERDRMLLRFAPDQEGRTVEPWYWAKLTHLARRPFRQRLKLGDLDLAATRPSSLRIELRGWSSQSEAQRSELKDHRVEVSWNGHQIAAAEWDGQAAQVVEVAELPRDLMVAGPNVLEVRVPPRRPKGQNQPLVDVVMVNWVELDYPRQTSLLQDQAILHLLASQPSPLKAGPRPEAGRALQLQAASEPELFSPTGIRLRGSRLSPSPPSPANATAVYAFDLPAHSLETPAQSEDASATHRLFAVTGGNYRVPAAVRPSRAPRLLDSAQQADYLIITHPELREAVENLAKLHRERGLNVLISDVQEIYDDFHHGIPHPSAIRSFIAHAYHQWQRPAPRFVLLVGDASWDVRNPGNRDIHYVDWTFEAERGEAWTKNESSHYEQQEAGAHRNLVPTWSYQSYEGHAASDNYFVAVDGDDLHPDLAIGRLPLTEPAEVQAVVAKIQHYIQQPEVGPWRRSLLWITDEQQVYQGFSELFANRLARRGFASDKVFPGSKEDSNAEHQDSLRKAFDRGHLLVHFAGHGGRYIWRTGAADLEKNHDLFTLEDLDQLQPHGRLPLVLSMTCYSAPFDHPLADSIGEKLLRVQGRGAVAVLAASWRNNPSPYWSDLLLRSLMQPGTVGEAVMQAKRQLKNDLLVATYNLLGDPALPLALPGNTVQIESVDDGLQVEIGVDDFRGRALVEWLDIDGQALHSEEHQLQGPHLTLPATQQQGTAVVRVYAWNTDTGVDALGALDLRPPNRQAASARVAARSGP